MFKPNRFALILGLAGAMAGLSSLTAEQRDPDAAGVAEAVRYEKAKQAAADRQARIEGTRERPSDSADRMASEPRRKAKDARRDSADRGTPRQEPDKPQH
jgi:hypothetical protein